MKIQPFGDAAILIGFEQHIAEEEHRKVMELQAKIEAMQLPYIRYTIPAFCSLTLAFDPQKIKQKEVIQMVKEWLENLERTAKAVPRRMLKVPVCYDTDLGPDWEEMKKQTALSVPEMIALHSASVYRVYMLGFLPGFPYMGKLNKALYCKRKANPRKKVPARSVALAGEQTGIYPSETPGGWQIIGRTPLPVFQGKSEQPFLFKPGDRVTFYAISKENFLEMEEAIKTAKFNWETVYGKVDHPSV